MDGPDESCGHPHPHPWRAHPFVLCLAPMTQTLAFDRIKNSIASRCGVRGEPASIRTHCHPGGWGGNGDAQRAEGENVFIDKISFTALAWCACCRPFLKLSPRSAHPVGPILPPPPRRTHPTNRFRRKQIIKPNRIPETPCSRAHSFSHSTRSQKEPFYRVFVNFTSTPAGGW